jgi:outer membrane protein assembly factor BamB
MPCGLDVTAGSRRSNQIPFQVSGCFVFGHILPKTDFREDFLFDTPFHRSTLLIPALHKHCKAGLFSLCLLLCASPSFAQQFRSDASHSGVYSSAAPEHASRIVWRFQTAGRVFSSPVVSGGMLYAGSADGFLYALDAATGQLKWKAKSGGAVHSSPAVDSGMVYFLSQDGNAYALDAATGAERWKFSTQGESRQNVAGIYGFVASREVVPDPWDFYLSSPAIADGVVYFGSGDHHVYALDARTGKLRWSFEAATVVHATPAISGGLVYAGDLDGHFYALDAATGAKRWQFTAGSDGIHFMQGIPGSAAVSEGVVVFGSRDAFLYGLDAATGKQLWKQSNSNSWVIASPAIAAGTIYVTTSDTYKLRALRLHTGEPLYELSYKAYSFSSPAIAGQRAYFGSFDGILWEADLEHRQIRAAFSSPARDSHMGYLDANGSPDNKVVFAPQVPGGADVNSLEESIVGIDRLMQLGAILSSPTIANGTVYFSSADGSIYALQ